MKKDSIQLLILVVIFLMFVSAIISKDKPSLKLLGIVGNEASLSQLVPTEDLSEIKKSLKRVFMKRRCGGDNERSYSLNGAYTAIKSIDPECHPYADFVTVITTIKDRNGLEIWKGRTGQHVLISNNGENFVCSDLAFPLSVDIYGFEFPEPINRYKNKDISDWAFSEEGDHLIMWGMRTIYYCTSDGELIWKKYLASPEQSSAAISPDGLKIAIDQRIVQEPAMKLTPQTDIETEKMELAELIWEVKMLKRRNQKERAYEKINYYRQRGKHTLADTLKKVLEESTVEKKRPKEASSNKNYKPSQINNYISIITNDGLESTYEINEIGTIRSMSFSMGDGNYLAVTCNNKVLLLNTQDGELLWRYIISRNDVVVDLFDIEFSHDNEYITVSGSYFPTGPGIIVENKLMAAIFDINGMLVEKIDLDGRIRNALTFSEDDKYLVVITDHPNEYSIIKID